MITAFSLSPTALSLATARSRAREVRPRGRLRSPVHDGGGAACPEPDLSTTSALAFQISRGEAVLRRPHVRPRASRVVRDRPRGTTQLWAGRCSRLTIFLYQAEDPGKYSRRETGLHHLAFLVESRAVVREKHEWARARDAVILDRPREFPQYGNTVSRPTGLILMGSSSRRSAIRRMRASATSADIRRTVPNWPRQASRELGADQATCVPERHFGSAADRHCWDDHRVALPRPRVGRGRRVCRR